MADLATRIPACRGIRPGAVPERAWRSSASPSCIKAGMWPLGFWLPHDLFGGGAARRRAVRDPQQGRRLRGASRLSAAVRNAEAADARISGTNGCCSAAWRRSRSARSGCLPAAPCRASPASRVLISSGTLLAAIGAGAGSVLGGALFYLVSSTLGDQRLLSADRAGRAAGNRQRPGCGGRAGVRRRIYRRPGATGRRRDRGCDTRDHRDFGQQYGTEPVAGTGR